MFHPKRNFSVGKFNDQTDYGDNPSDIDRAFIRTRFMHERQPELSATNRVWFECRIKGGSTSATTNRLGIAVGLGQVGRLVTLGQQASTSAVAAIDSVTLFKSAVGTTAIQTVIGNGTATVVNATAGTFAASTYTKLGFYWNGTTGTFYQDGAALTTTITSASTQFPATDSLCFMLSILGGSSASSETATVDWVRVAFERTFGSNT
jgi:hypothetical protein